MNEFRKRFLREKQEEIEKVFEKIKDNPKPDVLDLWFLSEEYFVKWRQKHDFPLLLKHFDNNLLFFKEWKDDNKLTDELIINNGRLTPFFEHKKLSRKKKLFLVEQVHSGKRKTFVAYKKLEGEIKHPDGTYQYSVLLEFYSYMDWLRDRQKTEKVLKINLRHSPNSDIERVFIHAEPIEQKSKFELLKMGGIELPVNGFGILMRGKFLEFVNLCGLKLFGRISFGEEGNLECSYSACDNMEARDLDIALLDFQHCSVTNFKVVDSKLQSWKFYDCVVNGDFQNVLLCILIILDHFVRHFINF